MDLPNHFSQTPFQQIKKCLIIFNKFVRHLIILLSFVVDYCVLLHNITLKKRLDYHTSYGLFHQHKNQFTPMTQFGIEVAVALTKEKHNILNHTTTKLLFKVANGFALELWRRSRYVYRYDSSNKPNNKKGRKC